MEKIKALLYCCKNGKKLVDTSKYDFDFPNQKMSWQTLNGKIVAECNYEVEEIRLIETPEYAGSECNTFVYDVSINFETKTLTEDKLCKQSCLNACELNKYLDLYKEKEIYGYAIHIKNLKERVMELSDVYKYDHSYDNMFGWIAEENEKYIPLKKVPQNMCRVWIFENGKWVMYILISVRPEWMCLILNKDKDVEVRKRVLKGMI